MAVLAAAYDNIRLIRRKIAIARFEATQRPYGSDRDAAILRAATLSDELVDAVQDFADAGFEQRIADMVATITR